MNTLINRLSDTCPHFSKEMQSCGLRCEGIYLPLRVHVMSFCLTTMYNQCTTFKEYCIATNLIVQKGGNASNEDTGRRRHHRKPEKRTVLLRTCDLQGAATGDFIERAITVDYSQGGMRLTINREIPSDTPLLFDFDNDFIVPQLQGVAQLCWHRRSDKNPSMIEAGLVFKDNFSKFILASQLGN